MIMEYPIYENGKRRGTLTVSEDGLYTVFSASLPAGAGLYRLWLVGEDRNYCLGLLEPAGDSRVLNRRLSRSAVRNLPRQIKYALATTGRAVFRLRKPQPQSAPQPVRSTQANGSTSLNWTASTMGCYTAADSISRLVAIPTSIRGDDSRLRFVNIKGCRYMVFRY